MKQRMKLLEQTVLQLTKRREEAPTKSNTEIHTQNTPLSAHSSQLSEMRATQDQERLERPNKAKRPIIDDLEDETQSSVDGMGAVISNDRGDAPECGYFGIYPLEPDSRLSSGEGKRNVG
jgi:hypothetical protein